MRKHRENSENSTRHQARTRVSRLGWMRAAGFTLCFWMRARVASLRARRTPSRRRRVVRVLSHGGKRFVRAEKGPTALDARSSPTSSTSIPSPSTSPSASTHSHSSVLAVAPASAHELVRSEDSFLTAGFSDSSPSALSIQEIYTKMILIFTQ